MYMSAELFQSIVQSLRADPQSCDDEKRTAPRAGFSGSVMIVPPGRAQGVEAQVRDVSVAGIGLLHSQPMKCGQEFILELADPTSDGQNGVVCTVARWQPLSEKLFLIGAKFTRTVKTNGDMAANRDVADLQSRLRSAGLY